MAGNSGSFEFDFLFNWDQPEQSTKAIFGAIRAEIKRLKEEIKRLETSGAGGSRPRGGSAQGRELQSAEETLAILQGVAAKRKELLTKEKVNKAELGIADVAADEAVARRKRNAAIGVLTNKKLSADADAINATVAEATERRKFAAASRVALQKQLLGEGTFRVKNPERGSLQNLEARAKINDDLLRAQAEVDKTTRIQRDYKGGLQAYTQKIAEGKLAQETLNKQIRIAVEEAKAADTAEGKKYRDAQAELTLVLRERKAAEEAAVNALLRERRPFSTVTRGEELARIEAQNAVDRQRQATLRNAEEQRIILADRELLAAKTQETLLSRQVAAQRKVAVQAELLGPGTFRVKNPQNGELENVEARAKINAELLAAREQINKTTRIQRDYAGGLSAYAQKIAEGRVAQDALNARVKAEVERVKAGTGGDEYRRAQADLTIALRERKVAEQRALKEALDKPVRPFDPASPTRGEDLLRLESEAALEAQRTAVERSLAEKRLLLADTGLLKLKAEEKVTQETINNTIKAEAETLRANGGKASQDYLKAQAELTVAIRQRKAAEAAATNELLAQADPNKPGQTIGEGIVQLEAANALETQRLTSQRKLEEARLLLADESLLKLKAAEIAEQKRVNEAVQQRLNAEVINQQVAQAAADGRVPTRFQSFMARLATRDPANPRNPLTEPTLGQFVGSKALTTAAFAFSGVALFGTLNVLKEAGRQVVELQREFSILKTQLEETDRAGEFPALRDGILRVARETGVAADEVARMSILLTGNFANKDAGFIVAQLEAATKISKLSGLTVEEVNNSLQGLARTYNITFEEIGDAAAGLQARMGVSMRDTIEAVSFLAPAAKQSGASFQEIATVVAHIQQLSGKGGANIADSLARIIPTIQDNAEGLVKILEEIPGAGNEAEKAINLIGRGNTFGVLKLLIRDFNDLSLAQQQAVAALLGGTREAQTLNSLFTNTDELNKQLNQAQRPGEFAGSLDRQFKNLQKTLGQTFAEMRQAALQLGNVLESSGIIQSLTGILKIATELLSVLQPLIDAFNSLGDAATLPGGGNLLGTALTTLIAIKGFQFIRGQGGVRQGLGNAVAPFIAGATGGTAGTSAAATAAVVGPTTAAATSVGQQVVNALRPAARSGGRQFAASMGNALKTYTTTFTQALTVGGFRPIVGPGALAGLKAAAFSTGGMIATIVAATVVADVISGARTKAQSAEDQFRQQVRDEITRQASSGVPEDPTKRARELLEASKDIDRSFGAENAGYKILGTDSPGKAQQEESAKFLIDRARNRISRLLAGGLDSERVARNFGEIQKEFDGQLTEEAVNAYDKALKKAINTARSKGLDIKTLLRKGNQKTNAGQFLVDVLGDNTTENLGTLREQLDQGVISYSDYIEQLEEDKRLAAEFIKNSAGKQREKYLKGYIDADNAIRKAASENIKTRAESLLNLRQQVGLDFGETDIAILVGQLKNEQFTDPTLQAETLNKIMDGLGQILRDRADKAKTAAERLKILQEGEVIPPEVRFLNVRNQVQQIQGASSVSNKDLSKIAAATGDGNPQDVINAVARIVEVQQVSVQQALLQYLRAERAEIVSQLQALARVKAKNRKKKRELRKRIKDLEKSLGIIDTEIGEAESDIGLDVGVFNPDKILGSAQEIEKTQDELANEAKAAALARIDFLKALAGNDPVQQAEFDLQKADVELSFAKTEAERYQALAARAQADQSLREARLAIINSQIDFIKAVVARDPVKVAEADVFAAKVALFTAQGDAARNQAAAQLVTAQKALEQAMSDILNSQIDLAIAVASAAGNSIQTALLQLQLAQQRLDQARAQGAGQAELNQLQAGVVQAQAALRDANLREQEALIDFNLQTKKISTQQAIAQYQALLNNADILGLTEQQTRELILKIQSLKQGLSQDLQFNLPSELRLPTLYEARRLNQGGYQDNRIVQIQLNANTQFDAQSAVNQIIDAVNQPPVNGTSPRIY